MSENSATSTPEEKLDSALATMVTAYTDSAPDAPDLNRVLVERAGRPAASDRAGQRWARPALAGVLTLVVLAGGFAAVRAASRSGEGGQIIVPADPAERGDQIDQTVESDEPDRESNGSDAEPEAAGDQSSDQSRGRSGDAETPSADLGSLVGAEAAGDLPDAAPDTFWAVAGDAADLMQVDARTGEILVSVGGWGRQVLGEGDRGQALQRPDVSPDGTVYVDDCCEPAFGSVFRFAAGETFEPGRSAWQIGLNPEVSPSGAQVMLSVGSSLQIVTATGEPIASLGDPAEPFEGLQFVPLAWIDERSIAVRLFGPVEEIRIYDLDSGRLTERKEARRVVADRFYMDGAVRADGMLVIATRRPNGNTLGLAGGGDLVGEVIDPQNGDLVTEFDLPDMIFEIDYDSSGRFLITSGDDRVVRWFGAGQSGVLAEGAISASWD